MIWDRFLKLIHLRSHLPPSYFQPMLGRELCIPHRNGSALRIELSCSISSWAQEVLLCGFSHMAAEQDELAHVWIMFGILSCLESGLWHAKLAQLYFEIPKWCFIVFMFLHGRFPTTQAHPTCTIMTGSHSPSQQSKHFGQTGWENTSSFSLVTTSGIHVYPELSHFFFSIYRINPESICGFQENKIWIHKVYHKLKVLNIYIYIHMYYTYAFDDIVWITFE